MNIKKVSGTNFGMATIKSTNALKQTLGYLLKEKHFSPKEINDEFKQIHKFWPKESDVVEIEKFEGIWNGFNRNFKEVIGKLTTVEIESGVTTIGKYALSANLYCASLETDDPFFTGEESTDNTTIFLPSTIKYLADGMAYMRETHAKINRTVDRGGTVGSSANHLSFNQSKEDATNIPIELLHANDPSYGQTYPAFILRAQMFINVQFEDISINCIATASDISTQGNTTFGGFGVLSYTLFEMIPNTMAPGGTLESVVTYTFNCPDRTEFVFREGETMQSNGYYYTCSDIPSIIERIDDVPCYIENTTYPYTDFPQTTVKNQGGN